jgi:catechol 2,3-dioxygenase-like lactoylglutathione lyase family enzyme
MTGKPSALRLAQIGQIAINVKDLDRAVRFYRDTLGLSMLFQFPRLAFFDCGGVRLMLSLPEKPEFDHESSIIYYKVEDIQGACASLREQGVSIEQGPQLVAKMPTHDLWMAFFRDPDHNPLALMSEVKTG